MNGLTLSESYYHDCGKAVFESTFKSLMDRIAVGLVGPGSECFGFDDEYSQDHDWGPSFCLWVTEADFQTNRRELQDCYNALPKEHLGFGPRMMSPGETGRVGAMEISGFYQRYTGLNKPPTSLREWDLPPENLALCTNGRVFSDPLGDFSRWRSTLLDFYPEDMRLKKMADCCMHAGQSGQYNWQRGILRKDRIPKWMGKYILILLVLMAITLILWIFQIQRFSPLIAVVFAILGHRYALLYRYFTNSNPSLQ